MDNKINVNFSNSKINNNNFNNINRITPIKKDTYKGIDIVGGIVDSVENFNTSKKEKIYNEVINLLSGTDLPEEYKETAAQIVTDVLGKKIVLSSTGAKKKLIQNFDEVAQKMKEKNLDISPLLNSLINLYYPELAANLSEEYAQSIIDYLYYKNKNDDNIPLVIIRKTFKPIDEITDILSDEDDLSKYANLLDFLIDTNEVVNLDFDVIKEQVPGLIKIYTEQLPNELKKYGIGSEYAEQTEADFRKLWNSILKERRKQCHDALMNLYPFIGYQVEAYIRNNYGVTSSGLDMSEAIKKLSSDFPKFLKLLSKLDNSKGFDKAESINDMLNFLGADTSDKFKIIYNNILGDKIGYIGDVNPTHTGSGCGGGTHR